MTSRYFPLTLAPIFPGVTVKKVPTGVLLKNCAKVYSRVFEETPAGSVTSYEK